MSYDAFISYSHAADQRIAAALERALERFAKPWHKRRALDVFRDEGNLTLSSHLWGSIRRALDTSRYFIFLASPEAVQSPWVAKEVEYWKTHCDLDRVIVLLTEGDLVWDTSRGDFDPARSTAIPETLRGTFEGEPFFLDLRWARDVQDLSLANDRFRQQIVRLAATIRGLAPEDMAGEEAEQFRRTIRLRNATIVGLTVLTLLAATAAVIAFLARGSAVRSEGQARLQQSRAEQAATVAETRRLQAEAAEARAVDSAALAREREMDAARQRALAEQGEHAARVALARVSTQEGRRLADAGRPAEALAHFARALRADPDSLAASWVTSLILHEGLWTPGPALQHAGTVRAATFSPDGRRAATTSTDGTAHIWDTDTGAAVGAVLRHNASINAVVFSPDGSRLLTASNDGTARLWDAASGEPRSAPLPFGRSVPSANFSADGRLLVTSSADAAQVWNTETGRPVGRHVQHGNPESIDWAAFSPDGTLFVTTSADGTARLWHTETGQGRGLLRHRFDVFSADFSPDGRRIVTASADRTGRIWDVETGRSVGEPLQHKGFVLRAEFSPDGRRVVTASSDGTARIWDAETGQPVGLPLDHGATVNTATFDHDGRRVVTGSSDGTARVWDATTGTPLGAPLQHLDAVTAATFSPDGRRVLTASADTTARVWSAPIEGVGSRTLAHNGPVLDAAFSPDGRLVATASYDSTLEQGERDGVARVWDVATGALRNGFRHPYRVIACVFTPDGRRLITLLQRGIGTGSTLHSAAWDAVRAEQVELRVDEEHLLDPRRFSPDGGRRLIGERIEDARTGKLVLTIPAQPQSSRSAFSPDGRRVVTIARNAAQVWDASTGAAIGRMMQHGNDIHDVVFSPDGQRLAIGGSNDSARIWDTATGTAVGVPLRNSDTDRLQVVVDVTVSFSPDSRRVVTASNNGYARIWDASTGAPLGAPLRHGFQVYRARFSPDGTRLVTASLDRTARLWQVLPPGGANAATRLADLAEVVAGCVVSESGTVATLDPTSREARIRRIVPSSGGTVPSVRTLIAGVFGPGW